MKHIWMGLFMFGLGIVEGEHKQSTFQSFPSTCFELDSQPSECRIMMDGINYYVQEYAKPMDQKEYQVVHVTSASYRHPHDPTKPSYYKMVFILAPREISQESEDPGDDSFDWTSARNVTITLTQDREKQWKLVRSTNEPYLRDELAELTSETDLTPLNKSLKLNPTIISPLFMVGAVVGAIAILAGVGSLSQRHSSRRGYKTIHRARVSTATVNSRSQLYQSNPIPSTEDQAVAYSHEQNERFAV